MSRKKTGAMVMLGFFVVLGIAATKPPEEHKFKNLKVLPKKISMKELDMVMNGFNDALGVKCGFCHASSMDSSVRHLDFPSDAKPEKNIARSMMKMTGKINKKYFKDYKDSNGQPALAVSCMTCHRGTPHPSGPKK
jgi:hypothetical protein